MYLMVRTFRSTQENTLKYEIDLQYYVCNAGDGRIWRNDFGAGATGRERGAAYDRWIDKYPDRFSEHPEWLQDCNGAALAKNGLIVYYHAPEIGCYSDGQFNAVIPYEELKSLPHGLLIQ